MAGTSRDEPPLPVLRVGLTGGIAAGKSTVSGMLRELGAAVVDHDTIAREVVAPNSPGLAAVAEAFGPDVVTVLGELDRGALAAVVVDDAVARERLNAIVHPLVHRAARRLEDAAVAAGHSVVVHDIPLLVETGQQTLIQMSDPFATGANLLGTADWDINYWFSDHPTILATTKVLAIVTGHILGVIAAHDRALVVLPRRHQLTGQLPLLGVMVL